MKTNCSERQKKSRKDRKAAGGKQISVMLERAAAENLVVFVKRGESISSVVNRLLSSSNPKADER